MAADLLGAEVARRSDEEPRARDADVVDEACDAEVGELRVPGAARKVRGLEEHVRRLHVAVHDAALVDDVQRLGEIGEQPRGIRWADRAEPQRVAEVVAVDELHHEVLPARCRVVRGVVEPHEGAVRDAREQRGLGLAALGVVDALRRLGEHLHGHRPAEREVDAPVHAGHAAAADEAVEAVAVTERGTREGVAAHAAGGRGHASEGSRPA